MATLISRERAEQAEILEERGKFEESEECANIATMGEDVPDEEEPVSSNHAQFSGLLMADIEEDTIDYCWRNWFPKGCVTILAGLGGLGKSTVMADIVARVTRDDLMPDGSHCETPGGAVVIAMEEKTSSVVRPRLRKAGANLERIIDLSKVEREIKAPGDPARSPFMLPDDLPVLRRAIKRVNASIVVVDCLMSAVNPKVSTFRNQSARQVVTTLQDLAEEMGVCIVILNHFTKSSLKDPLVAMAGSKGFVDVVRSVVMLTADASNSQRRVLSLVKHNNTGEVPQIVFTHDGSRVQYLTGVTPTQALVNEAQALSQSRQLVLKMLADEPNRAFTPTELAQRADVHYDSMKSVLRRMAEDGQVIKTSRGFYQALPPPEESDAPTAPSAPLVAPLPDPISSAKTQLILPTNGHSILQEVMA